MDLGPQGDEAPTTGAQFGKYRIIRKIGEGAFGAVYEALLPGPMGFTKRVAIKKLRSYLVKSDPKFVQSMVNEARIGGLLHNAHIVDVLEFDRAGEHYFIAMEFVDGATLAEIISVCRDRRVLLPRFAIIDLAIQVCRGLDYAHTFKDPKGVPLQLVHRDLKPSNIIVDSHGTAKILDFGIAKAASNLFNTTSSAMVKGTPRYMSPEQIAAERDLTPRSDVFSMGVVLYELITGRVLFNAESLPALIHKIVYEEHPERIEEAEAAFPGSGAILARALQKKPDDRYPDARAMAADLRELGRSFPAEADMADVIGRLMSAVDRTQSVEIRSSGDLDLESSSYEPVVELGTESDLNPITPPDPTSAGWDRFSAVFDRPGEAPAPADRLHAPAEPAGTAADPAQLGPQDAVTETERRPPLVPPPASLGSTDAALAAARPPRRWPVIVLGLLVLVLIGVVAGLMIDMSRSGGGAPGALAGDALAADAQPRETGATEAATPGEPTTSDDAAATGEAAPEPSTPEPATPEPSTPDPADAAAEAATPEPVLEPDPTPAPPPAKPGTITVSSRPYADFYVDGVRVETAGMGLKQHAVQGGSHTVRIVCSKEGKEKTFMVVVDGGDHSLGCWNFKTDSKCK